MAHKVIKTEHNGAKHGTGFLTKQEVKSGSRKRRRQNWKREITFHLEKVHTNKITDLLSR